jgi:hypothetical protein
MLLLVLHGMQQEVQGWGHEGGSRPFQDTQEGTAVLATGPAGQQKKQRHAAATRMWYVWLRNPFCFGVCRYVAVL